MSSTVSRTVERPIGLNMSHKSVTFNFLRYGIFLYWSRERHKESVEDQIEFSLFLQIVFVSLCPN